MANILEIISCISKGEDGKIGRPVGAVVEILKGEDLEYRSLYTQLFFMEKFPAPAKIIVNKYSNSHQGALITTMHFMAMIFEMIKGLQDYRRAVSGK